MSIILDVPNVQAKMITEAQEEQEAKIWQKHNHNHKCKISVSDGNVGDNRKTNGERLISTIKEVKIRSNVKVKS